MATPNIFVLRGALRLEVSRLALGGLRGLAVNPLRETPASGTLASFEVRRWIASAPSGLGLLQAVGELRQFGAQTHDLLD